MPKVFVCYDSKYGNTKIVAENIMKGLEKVKGLEVTIGYVKGIEPKNLVNYDMIIIGGPNHMGRTSRTIKKFVNRLTDTDLRTKKVTVFGTYAGKARVVDRAVRKLENLVKKKLSGIKFVSPTLSIRVNKIRGPIIDGELPKCVEFGKKIANQLINEI